MTTGLTSHTGAVLGTPSYIAPEIWLGEKAEPATDQYALACIVYEALTGKMLFTGETPPAIMTRHVLKGAELPAEWPDDVPPGVSQVLSTALAKEPKERYASLASMIGGLAELPGQTRGAAIKQVIDRGPSSHSVGLPPRAVENAPQPAWGWKMGAVVVIALIGVVLFSGLTNLLSTSSASDGITPTLRLPAGIEFQPTAAFDQPSKAAATAIQANPEDAVSLPTQTASPLPKASSTVQPSKTAPVYTATPTKTLTPTATLTATATPKPPKEDKPDTPEPKNCPPSDPCSSRYRY